MRDPLRSIQADKPFSRAAAFGSFRFEQCTAPGPSLSGDVFDFLSTGDGIGTICFGDAAGHGSAAAMISALTRRCLRAEPSHLTSPARMIAGVNRLLTKAQTKFVSLWIGAFDQSGDISFVDAGHGHWFVLEPAGAIRALSRAGSIPVGIDPHAEFVSQQFRLEPGEKLVLFSDGITEQRSPSGEEFGLARLLGIVRSSRGEGVGASVLRAARDHSGTGMLCDDASIAIIERL